MKYLIYIVLITLNLSANAQTLDDYFKVAAEKNPGIQARYKEFEAAMQRIPQVNSLPDPSVSFGYFLSPVETRVGPQRARFSLSQMFPWFGTLKAQADAAALQAEAKYFNFLDARNQLYYRVAATYYPLYELREWQRIEQENVRILESYKDLATVKFQNGQAPLVDALRVDLMLKEAQTELEILQKKEASLRMAFNKTLSRDESEAVQLPDSLTAELLAPRYRRDSLLTDNPLLTELERRIEAARAAETVAEKQAMPKLGAGLDYVVVGKRTDMNPAGNGRDVLMPMVTVGLPIYRKKYAAAIKEAQLMQDNYNLQKEELSNTLVASYEMAWFEIEQQQELLTLYRQQIQESGQILDLLITAYSNSGANFEEVLRVQERLLKYQKMSVTALKNYRTALARIDYLTAGY